MNHIIDELKRQILLKDRMIELVNDMLREGSEFISDENLLFRKANLIKERRELFIELTVIQLHEATPNGVRYVV